MKEREKNGTKSCTHDQTKKKKTFFLFVQQRENLLHTFIYRHTKQRIIHFVNICCETSQFIICIIVWYAHETMEERESARVRSRAHDFIFIFQSFIYLMGIIRNHLLYHIERWCQVYARAHVKFYRNIRQ